MTPLLDLLSGRRTEPAECVVSAGTPPKEAARFYPYLTSVTVDCTREEAWEATMEFDSSRDEHGRWAVQDAGLFEPWVRVVVQAAFGPHTEEVFRGYVRDVRADYPEDAGRATVTVECQDESLALDREHVRRSWGSQAPTSDAAILAEIVASRHNLAVHPQSARGRQGIQVNQDGTDIRFLRHRAQENGYELIFRAGSVYFGPMRLDAPPQETIMVYAGADTSCIAFGVHADGHAPEQVAFDLADPACEAVRERVVAPDLPRLGLRPADPPSAGLRDFVWRMRREGSSDEEALAAKAQKRANDAAMRLRAQGELDGSLYGHVLRVGEPVKVDGVGETFGGTYYVDSVRHSFSDDGYRQRFSLLRNAYGDVGLSAANPLRPVFAR